ncbi:MAG: hypothetical protein MJE68_27735 [Proteobacteria bacterium]|nr:hypothetical protein [Pseudomonadota bacterium]
MEQNSAPSANRDGSSDSISTTGVKSNERKLAKNGDYGSQGDELEGTPGELSNYEESKGGKREREKLNDERGDRDGGEISENGSIDQTKVVAKGEVNSDVHVKHLNGKEAIGESSKDAFSDDGSLGEAGGLMQDGVTQL